MRVMLLRFVVCSFLLVGFLCSADAPGQLTREEAANLVKQWLTTGGYPTGSPRFTLDSDIDRTDFPVFYFFSASYEQGQSVPTLGHFAVNQRTADLWDWELCKRLSTPSLRTSQKLLRSKMRLPTREFRESSKAAPCSGPT